LLEPVEGILGEGLVRELLGGDGAEAGKGGVDPGLQVLMSLVLVFAGLKKAFEFVGVASAPCFLAPGRSRTR
jgi:hypothetical protein